MVNENKAGRGDLDGLTDEALCALVKQGSRDADELLVSRYHRLCAPAPGPISWPGATVRICPRRGCSA